LIWYSTQPECHSALHLLLQHGNLRQFLEKIFAEYDQVLLDTPAVLKVTDATILTEHAGKTYWSPEKASPCCEH
jgi:hypothetical protein